MHALGFVTACAGIKRAEYYVLRVGKLEYFWKIDRFYIQNVFRKRSDYSFKHDVLN